MTISQLLAATMVGGAAPSKQPRPSDQRNPSIEARNVRPCAVSAVIKRASETER